MASLTDRREPPTRVAGWAFLGVIAAFLAGGIAAELDRPVRTALAAAATLLLCAGAILGPRAGLLPVAVLAGAAVTVLANGEPADVAWFVVPVLVGWIATTGPTWAFAAYWAGAVLLFSAEALFTVADPGWAAWLGGTCFAAVGCWFGARQRALVVQLRAAQAGLAVRAQAEERNRIARELHDVIAHSLTVSLLHVSSARLTVADDPADAARALAEAERLGRQSLSEVRHAVGLLRQDGAADPTAPLPGSTDVAALVERFRQAGADVRAHLDGDLDTLPGTVGLATYRILQEALTNAARHAPQAVATVRLAVTPDAVRLTVDSSGAPGTGDGLGLLGMRERAALLGGSCSAGPGGSGWLVRAELPRGPG